MDEKSGTEARSIGVDFDSSSSTEKSRSQMSFNSGLFQHKLEDVIKRVVNCENMIKALERDKIERDALVKSKNDSRTKSLENWQFWLLFAGVALIPFLNPIGQKTVDFLTKSGEGVGEQ